MALRRLFHSLTGHVFCKHEKREHDLGKLPPELTDLILSHLSVPDRICFALTCRCAYGYYISFLEFQGLQTFPLFPTIKRPMPPDFEMEPQPIEEQSLLFRLQTSRWKYCSGCWKLHRPSAWRRPPSLPLQESQRKLACMPYAGRIELCLCSTITFPDVRYFLTSRRYCWFGHECIFEAHPHARVTISSGLGKTGTKIVLGTRYKFFFGLAESSPFTREKLSSIAASTRKAKHWLRKFFNEAGSSFTGGQDIECVDAYLTSVGVIIYGRDESLPALCIHIERDLGNGRWRDIKWKRNCCNSSEPEKRRLLLASDNA